MVDKRRIRKIRSGNLNHGPVIYLMSRDHRVDDNWALLYAQELAIKNRKQLIVVCPIGADYPEAPQRQINFLSNGLKEVNDKLSKKGIPFAS